jgi:hypothetical protein
MMGMLFACGGRFEVGEGFGRVDEEPGDGSDAGIG